MESFYLSHDEFWTWFNRDTSRDGQLSRQPNKLNTIPSSRATSNILSMNRTNDLRDSSDAPSNKRQKTSPAKIRHIMETEAADRTDKRYVVLYGRHRPGKKTKVWEGDGYLSLVNGVAHLCDLKGRMLEEPTLLDEIDLQLVEDQSDLLIGTTDVQIIEVDER